MTFLDASSHHYNRVCPSVRPLVRPSVGPSVGMSSPSYRFVIIAIIPSCNYLASAVISISIITRAKLFSEIHSHRGPKGADKDLLEALQFSNWLIFQNRSSKGNLLGLNNWFVAAMKRLYKRVSPSNASFCWSVRSWICKAFTFRPTSSNLCCVHGLIRALQDTKRPLLRLGVTLLGPLYALYAPYIPL